MNGATTLDEIERFAQTPRDQLATAVLKFRFNPGATKSDFQALVCDALDLISAELSTARDNLNAFGEDQITDVINLGLRFLGFTATRETSVNGHCDMTIGDKGFVWLAEAKIYKGYDYLLKGFQQLCDRYATGLPDHDRGALLIYFKTAGVRTVMDEWRTFVLTAYGKMTAGPLGPLKFDSTHPHHITELPYHVRHLPIILMHDPSDVKPRIKRARKKKPVGNT